MLFLVDREKATKKRNLGRNRFIMTKKKGIAVILCMAIAGTLAVPGAFRAEEALPAIECEQNDDLTASVGNDKDLSSAQEGPRIPEESLTETSEGEASGTPGSSAGPQDASSCNDQDLVIIEDQSGYQAGTSEDLSDSFPYASEGPAGSPEDGDQDFTEGCEDPVLDEIGPAEEEVLEDADGPLAAEMVPYEKTQVLSGNCGLNGASVEWKFQDGILTVSGNGAMDDYYITMDLDTGETSGNLPPWEGLTWEIEEVRVEEGVTAIGRTAFADCYNLKKVTISSSVTCIREKSFVNDYELKEISLGSGVELIETDAFYGTGIISLTLPASLKKISEDTFWGIYGLQNVYIEGGGDVYQSVDGVLFQDGGKTLVYFPAGRTGSYHIPDGTVKISGFAFYSSQLSELTMTDTVTDMGSYSLSSCSLLRKVVFSKGLKVIPDSVCYNDPLLSTVVIPKGVVEIEKSAFSGCYALTDVTIPSTVKSIGAYAFPDITQLTVLNPGLMPQGNGAYIEGVKISLKCNAEYQKAFKVLQLVNKERKSAGLGELKMDASLLETAMLRSAEIVLYWGHERPSGSMCTSANPLMSGENIAMGSVSAKGVMSRWMDSPGHRGNILNSSYKSIGIGCVNLGSVYYWVQCFGNDTAEATTASAWPDREQRWDVLVKKDPKYYKADFWLSKKTLKVGEVSEVSAYWYGIKLDSAGILIESSDPSVCSIEKGKIRAIGAGKAKITVYYDNYREKALVQTIKVSEGQKVKVIFNPNGGKVKEKSAYKIYKSAFGVLPGPTRKGYSFLGWYTAKSGGSKIAASTTVSSKSTMTLYAHWEKINVGGVTVKSLKNPDSKQLKVTLKGVSGAAGYQIVYATNAKFTKGKKNVFAARESKKISGLKIGKTYYVKARAYVTDSTGAKVYGKFSPVKKIKLKK